MEREQAEERGLPALPGALSDVRHWRKWGTSKVFRRYNLLVATRLDCAVCQLSMTIARVRYQRRAHRSGIALHIAQRPPLVVVRCSVATMYQRLGQRWMSYEGAYQELAMTTHAASTPWGAGCGDRLVLPATVSNHIHVASRSTFTW